MVALISGLGETWPKQEWFNGIEHLEFSGYFNFLEF